MTQILLRPPFPSTVWNTRRPSLTQTGAAMANNSYNEAPLGTLAELPVASCPVETTVHTLSQRPRLPPELTDKVIDHLHSDIPTLCACALAGRALHARARAYLFRTVEIWTSRKCVRATSWFVEPAYARCVRTLRLTMGDATEAWGDERTAALLRCFHALADEGSNNQEQWLGTGVGVEMLCLRWFSFANMPQTSRLLALPSVTTLELTHLRIEVPHLLEFLNAFPALESLTVGSGLKLSIPSYYWNSMSPLPSARPQPRLRTLDFANGYCPVTELTVFQWFLDQPPDQIHIKRLGYVLAPKSLQLPASVLKALVEMVAFGCGHVHKYSPVIIEHLAVLRTLEVHFFF
ncbi:hypothetical protein OBBRIDRAFT_854814 [Obba rivulosa]|uniref:F-box domain-containing protein n=1 Tax=Obba rivulosa TaxID=1052685 RepID=A0A8E2J3L4_9APHY|nr:hypothetical protein OBBRIDRAFT_854814 [Obba rivulosa]